MGPSWEGKAKTVETVESVVVDSGDEDSSGKSRGGLTGEVSISSESRTDRIAKLLNIAKEKRLTKSQGKNATTTSPAPPVPTNEKAEKANPSGPTVQNQRTKLVNSRHGQAPNHPAQPANPRHWNVQGREAKLRTRDGKHGSHQHEKSKTQARGAQSTQDKKQVCLNPGKA